MKISIIITTKNEEFNLQRLFNSMKKIKDKVEIIIVDAGSTDKTIDVAKKFGVKKIYSAPNSLRGEGRNVGLRKTKAEVIVFLDADTELTDQWYDELITSIKEFDIVAGYSPDPNGKTLPRVPVYMNGQDITYPTCNIAYRKKVLDKVGFFRDDMVTAEDIELNYRCVKAGYSLFYNPKMIVYHYQRSTKKGFAKQAFWNGYGRKQLNRIHPDLKKSHQHGLGIRNAFRLGFGFIGYAIGRLLRRN